MKVAEDKDRNLEQAEELCRKLAREGAELIVLPEMFNCPYEREYIEEYGEKIPGKTTRRLASIAGDAGVFLVGGSIPERDGESLYNTSPIFSPDGQLIARHRKVHLFNVDIPGKIVFRESDFLDPGDEVTEFQALGTKIGVAVCYDLRFPELMRKMALDGCELLVLPGAFNTTTGPAHWKTSLRSRAIDNQVFVVACSPARNLKSSYHAYGHSMVVDPWGAVLAEAEDSPVDFEVDLDLNRLEEVRRELPLLSDRRPEVY